MGAADDSSLDTWTNIIPLMPIHSLKGNDFTKVLPVAVMNKCTQAMN